MAVAVTQTTNSLSRVEEIFVKAVTSSPTFDSNIGIQQIAAVRDKFSMANLSTNTNVLQAYATAPSETGDITVGDDEFTITKKSINVPFAYDQLANTKWKEAIDNIHAMGLPADLEEAIVTDVANIARRETESKIWNNNDGATGSPADGSEPGFIKIINDELTAASLTAQILSGANDFTDKTVIQGQLDAMIAVAPTALLDLTLGAKFFISPAVDFAYRRSLETQNNAVLEQSATRFSGFEIQVIPNLNSRTMLFGLPSNLGVGTPSQVSDMISLAVQDQRENQKNQANIFGNFGYGAGAQTTDWVTNENTTV